MSGERLYDEDEVAEILKRATASDPTRTPVSAGSKEGLSLSQLQEIGSEVGIPPVRMAEAARAVASRDPSGIERRFFGAARTVQRIVHLPRPLNDDEWTRLVVDLRETFDAAGQVSVEGSLRSWTNGNLRVHVEPDGHQYRVRMRTLKGDTGPRAAVGGVFVLLAALILVVTLVGGGDPSNLILGSAFALGGLGHLGYTRAALTRWAAERADQMEGLAERIPRLIGGPDGEGR
jgi:hypothetical protein